jgi:transposase
MAKVRWTDDFQKMYKENGQHPYAIRMLALAKKQEGYAVKHIATMINKNVHTVHSWIKLYNTGGLGALFSINPGRGRKPKTKVEPSTIKADIEALGVNKKGGRVVAEEVRQMLLTKHGAEYSLPGVYHLLHRLNFSWISVRSIHPKANNEAQETFKKNSTKMLPHSSPKG